MKSLLDTVSAPKVFIYTVNAGLIPADHWTQDVNVGGGRIIGEACHMIDLLRFLASSPIAECRSTAIQSDVMTMTLTFQDGSMGTIHYLSNGNKAFPKERLEVFCDGKVLQLDNFRKMQGYGWSKFSKMNLRKQNKGQGECVGVFVEAIKTGKSSPILFDEIEEVTAKSYC
jgi:predicted dehydrogenase